jgi:hypothetical protein
MISAGVFFGAPMPRIAEETDKWAKVIKFSGATVSKLRKSRQLYEGDCLREALRRMLV